MTAPTFALFPAGSPVRRRTSSLFVFAALTLGVFGVQAASPVAGPSELRPAGAAQLSLSAGAESEVALDEMTVRFAAEAEGTDIAGLNRKVLQLVQDGIATARKAPGVEARLSSVQTMPAYTPKGMPNGWRVRAEMAVKGNDLPRVGALAGDLARTMQMGGVEFSLSRKARDALTAQLTEQAAQALKLKAASVARSLGYREAQLLEVTLQDDFAGAPEVVHRPMMAKSMAMADSVAMPADAGTTRVTVRFSALAQLVR